MADTSNTSPKDQDQDTAEGMITIPKKYLKKLKKEADSLRRPNYAFQQDLDRLFDLALTTKHIVSSNGWSDHNFERALIFISGEMEQVTYKILKEHDVENMTVITT